MHRTCLQQDRRRLRLLVWICKDLDTDGEIETGTDGGREGRRAGGRRAGGRMGGEGGREEEVRDMSLDTQDNLR